MKHDFRVTPVTASDMKAEFTALTNKMVFRSIIIRLNHVAFLVGHQMVRLFMGLFMILNLVSHT